MIDTAALIAWLTERARITRSPLAKGIYEGLFVRIKRGDFDEEVRP